MPRRQRNTGTNNGNSNSSNSDLGRKIDALNNSINDLVAVMEDISVNSKKDGGERNPFIRPGSRRTRDTRESSRNFYYEWSQYYKAPRKPKSWQDMSSDEKRIYNQEKNKRKKEAQDFVKRSEARDELYRELRRSRFGETGVGRYIQSVMGRTQKLDNYGMMGKYMEANAAKIGTGLFGNGKVGAKATKAIGGFGKALGGASKILGGAFTGGLLLAIDALKLFFKAQSDYDKHSAEMYNAQAKQEQFQFEQAKQHLMLKNQMEIENVSASGDKQLKMLETQGQTMLDALKLSTGAYVKGIETSIGPMMKGINQTAYDAAKYSIDIAADYQKLGLHKGQREAVQGRFEELRELKRKGAISGLMADIGMADAEFISSMRQAAYEYEQKDAKHFITGLGRDERNNILYSAGGYETTEDSKTMSKNAITGEAFDFRSTYDAAGLGKEYDVTKGGAFMRWLGLASDAELERLGEKLGYTNQILRQNAESEKVKIDTQYKLAQTQMDYANQIADKQLEIQTEAAETVIDSAVEIKKMWLELAQQTEQWIEKFEATTNDLAKNLGYTNPRQLRQFQNTMFETAKVAAKFGKTYEDAVQMQANFFENSGRNRIFGKSDYGQLFGLGQYLGDDGLAATYASSMEIFNVGVADSVDMLDEALQDVNRMGLNGRKYTKTLVDNLKLAQKYNFKNGTKSLMDMAKWAENTRFNLGSLGGMLDKVHEGGLEGVITQGAQFQVLGGHAAMNADPIAMMYEAFADPEAYARRMQDMTKGYGQLDRITGETKFSGNEVMMMQQLAKIQGRSVEEVMDEVRARNKREVVAKQLNGNFDAEQQAFISNVAEYNKKTGQFQVKLKRGNEYVTEEVGNLTEEDLKNLMPEKHNERMEDYMQTVVTLLGQMTGEEEREKIEVASRTFADTIAAYNERLLIAKENFATNVDKYVEEIRNGQALATNSFEDFIKVANKGNKDVDEKVSEISKTAGDINSALAETARIIAEANARISGIFGFSTTMPETKSNVNKVEEIAKRAFSSVHGGNNGFGDLAASINKGNYDYFTKAAKEHLKIEDYYSDFASWKNEDKKKLFEELLGVVTDKQKMSSLGSSYYLNVPSGKDIHKYGDGKWRISTNSANDFISYGGPMNVMASDVTKINDGLVRAHPNDVGVFAKEGGPIGNFLDDTYGLLSSVLSGNNTIHFDTLRIDGRLELTSNGQSVDIMSELKNNPLLMRQLSRMLTEHISTAVNGGRGTLNIGIGSV